MTASSTGRLALITCPDCPPLTLCERAYLFVPEVGASRVYVCPEHGPVSIAWIVRVGADQS